MLHVIFSAVERVFVVENCFTLGIMLSLYLRRFVASALESHPNFISEIDKTCLAGIFQKTRHVRTAILFNNVGSPSMLVHLLYFPL